MRAMFLAMALGLGSVTTASSTQDIADFATQEAEAANVPGMNYAWVIDGAIESGEYGVTAYQGETQVTEDSTFIIGSVSKSFTALAIMQFVEAGLIKLDAPVETYLDELADSPSADITIRQYLSHTSGFSTKQGNETQADFSVEMAALERRIAAIAQQTPAYPAGSKWEYSNTNYQILGRVIEVLSGQSYADYVQERIFTPAGMDDTYAFAGEAAKSTVQGHLPWFGSRRSSEEYLPGLGTVPQGGIVSSAEDLARYMALMMNGEDDLISAASKTEMMTPANDMSPDYGFGWFLNTEKGVVFHSGASPGFEALATMVPAEKKGVAVLVNAGSGIGLGDTSHLRSGLSAKAIGLDYEGTGVGLAGKSTFYLVVLTPFIFLACMIWAWRKREAIRAKAGIAGLFSIWFPLLMMGVLAWSVFSFVPSAFGAPLSAIRVFVPDMVIAMVAMAVLGLVWAVMRIGIFYTKKPS